MTISPRILRIIDISGKSCRGKKNPTFYSSFINQQSANVHWLVNKRRMYKNARYTQLQDYRRSAYTRVLTPTGIF